MSNVGGFAGILLTQLAQCCGRSARVPRFIGVVYRAEQAMPVPVRVDLSSAGVACRPAAGQERSVAAGVAKPSALFAGSPWRTFRSDDGQKH